MVYWRGVAQPDCVQSAYELHSMKPKEVVVPCAMEVSMQKTVTRRYGSS